MVGAWADELGEQVALGTMHLALLVLVCIITAGNDFYLNAIESGLMT